MIIAKMQFSKADSALVSRMDNSTAQAASSGSELTVALTALPAAQRHGATAVAVLRLACDLTESAVDLDSELAAAGIDSLAATELASRLRSLLRVP